LICLAHYGTVKEGKIYMQRFIKALDMKSIYKTRNLTVRVSPYTYNMLEDIARNNDITLSNVVRRAIEKTYMKSSKRSKE